MIGPTLGTLPRALPGELETVRLDNGLTVCLLRNSQAPIVSTALVFRVGGRDDPVGHAGLAHFLEHMMFKGSARYAPGEVDRRTQALGGSNNAFTSHDLTTYWFSFAADRWSEALAIEADRMRGLRLDPEEIEAERRVIGEEIAMYEDDPWDALDLAVQAALFAGHPYARPVLGRVEELKATGRAELSDFHRRFYRPDNAVLVVAGALDDSAAARVSEAMRELEQGTSTRAESPEWRPAATAQRLERRQGELTRILLALPAPPADAEGSAELRLAATVLAEGRASRLQRALVEEGQLCLEVSASLAESATASSFVLSAELLPGVEARQVELCFADELARLRELPVGDEELERARQIFCADWVHALEQIHQQALVAGIALAQFDLGQPQRLLERVAATEAGALRQAARRWLDPAAGSVIGTCLPER